MSTKDPFRNLFIGGAVVAILHIVANVSYSGALLAFRFHDQIDDPWNTWVFWRFVISCTWIVPLVATILLWINYDQKFWYPIQTIVTIAYIFWGVVHVAWLVIELVNCNDKTGPDFDYPHCVNRFFPAETRPDFSFYIYLIAIATQLACTIFWWYFGYQLRLISAALLWATAASIVSNINDEEPTSHKAMKHYHKIIGQLIGNSLSNNLAQQKNVDVNHLPKEDIKYHELLGQRLYNELVTYQTSIGKSGTGVVSFPQANGSIIGKSIIQLLKSHNSHLVNIHFGY